MLLGRKPRDQRLKLLSLYLEFGANVTNLKQSKKRIVVDNYFTEGDFMHSFRPICVISLTLKQLT